MPGIFLSSLPLSAITLLVNTYAYAVIISPRRRLLRSLPFQPRDIFPPPSVFRSLRLLIILIIVAYNFLQSYARYAIADAIIIFACQFWAISAILWVNSSISLSQGNSITVGLHTV
jgi:hypothetical protein